jgi:hypothetical protein
MPRGGKIRSSERERRNAMYCQKGVLFIFLFAMLLSGCSSAFTLQPAQVQAFATPVPIYPPRFDQLQHAYLEIISSDVDLAAARATRLTAEYGGSLLDSSSWEMNGQRTISLEIEVPGNSFEGLYSALRKLGRVGREDLYYDEVLKSRFPYDMWVARITLMIVPTSSLIRPLPHVGWDPGATLQSAFAVFLKIFGLLVDVLIWVLVVAGPFLLIGLGIWWIARRLRHAPAGDQKDP